MVDKLFTSSYEAVKSSQSDDYLNYWIDHSIAFFKKYTKSAYTQKIIKFIVNNYKHANPKEPVEIPFVPAAVQEMIRGMNYYAPHFFAYLEDGTLDGAMSQEMADKAVSLIKNCKLNQLLNDFDPKEVKHFTNMIQVITQHAVSLTLE